MSLLSRHFFHFPSLFFCVVFLSQLSMIACSAKIDSRNLRGKLLRSSSSWLLLIRVEKIASNQRRTWKFRDKCDETFHGEIFFNVKLSQYRRTFLHLGGLFSLFSFFKRRCCVKWVWISRHVGQSFEKVISRLNFNFSIRQFVKVFNHIWYFSTLFKLFQSCKYAAVLQFVIFYILKFRLIFY